MEKSKRKPAGPKKTIGNIAKKIKEEKKKKMGTPKFAPGKGGGSDAARKGKGAVSKKAKGGRGRMAKGGRPGLYANIHAKRKSGRPMRKKGAKGSPTAANFRRAAQTVRKK